MTPLERKLTLAKMCQVLGPRYDNITVRTDKLQEQISHRVDLEHQIFCFLKLLRENERPLPENPEEHEIEKKNRLEAVRSGVSMLEQALAASLGSHQQTSDRAIPVQEAR